MMNFFVGNTILQAAVRGGAIVISFLWNLNTNLWNAETRKWDGTP